MKRNAFFLLLLGNGVLLAAVTALWVVGDAGWHPPAAQRPEAASLAPETIEIQHAELATLPETQQRPLFSPTRSPVAEAADGAAPIGDVDPILLGIFETKDTARGVIVRIEGEVYRVRIGEALGAWTLHAADGSGAVVFKNGEELLQLQLQHLPQPAPARAAAATGRTGAVPGRRYGAAPAAGGRATPQPQPAVPAATRPAPSTDSGQPTVAERIAERRRAAGSTTTDPRN